MPIALLVLKQGMACSSYVSGTHSLAFVTVPNSDVATKIAHGVLKNQLAACVNVIPGVKSIYLWKGDVNEDNELLLKIKTRSSLVDKLTEFVKKNHPYEVCEVVTVPIESGNAAYLSWISETLPLGPDNKE